MKKTNMKYHWFACVFLVLYLILVCLPISCNTKNVIVEPDVKVPVSYNFESCYEHDYLEMVSKYGSSNFYFYEAQAIMSLPMNNVNFYDSAFVKKVVVIFQLKNRNQVIQFTHPEGVFVDDSVTIDYIDGKWVDDAPIEVTRIPYPLSTALNIMHEMHVSPIDGTMVILRRSELDTIPEMPYYLFGNDTNFIVLDYNGNIKSK